MWLRSKEFWKYSTWDGMKSSPCRSISFSLHICNMDVHPSNATQSRHIYITLCWYVYVYNTMWCYFLFSGFTHAASQTFLFKSRHKFSRIVFFILERNIYCPREVAPEATIGKTVFTLNWSDELALYATFINWCSPWTIDASSTSPCQIRSFSLVRIYVWRM